MDARNHNSRAESNLLILVKEVVNVFVQHQATNGLERQDIFRPDLCDIKRVEVKLVFMSRIHHLNEETPLRIVPGSDGVIEILSSMAVVGSTDLDSFLIEEAFNPTRRFPVELHIVSFSGSVDKHVSVDTKAIHVPVVLWDTEIIKEEREHVETLRVVREEVQYPPVLLNVGFGIRFQGVDHVGELHAVADEEDGEVVANEIEVAFSGVELDGKTTRISESLGAATLVDDGGETNNDGSLDTGSSEKISTSEVGNVMSDFKETLCTGTSGMHNPLRDPLPVEVGEFLK